MDPLWISFILLAALAVMLAAGVWIALALPGMGFIGMVLFTDSPAGLLMATTMWGSSRNWALTALPLFIWMGDILFRSRVSEDMFRGLAPWMDALPGRLMHCNVIGCGIFAAISGSSTATALTIGKITVPELRKRNYDESMVVGSLAGAGTLGLLIPPSIILMLMFSGYIALWALLHRDRTPPRTIRMGLRQKLWEARFLIPTVLLIASVIGSIYAGIASPTEWAALGVGGARILSAASGSLAWITFS